jgi:hypothetical protein
LTDGRVTQKRPVQGEVFPAFLEIPANGLPGFFGSSREATVEYQGEPSKSANGIDGVRPSPGIAKIKLRNHHLLTETAGFEFVAVVGDGGCCVKSGD